MRQRASSRRPAPAWRPLAMAAAIAWIASAAAAPTLGQPARRVPAARSQAADADVRSLTRAMEMQLRLVYSRNLPEQARRSEQLRSAIAAWQASPRTAADQRAMAAWLRQSIRASMPGSTSGLPPVPTFAAAPQQTAPPRVAAPPAAGPTSRSVLRPALEPPPPAQRTHRETAQATVGGVNIEAEVIVSGPQDVQLYESQRPSLLDHHPASDQWPLDLPEGDPFVDDPLPPESDANPE